VNWFFEKIIIIQVLEIIPSSDSGSGLLGLKLAVNCGLTTSSRLFFLQKKKEN
jgi:hypothetical protein